MSSTKEVSNTKDRSFLNRQQYERIKELFPIKVFPSTVTAEELRHYNGQQSVVAILAKYVL